MTRTATATRTSASESSSLTASSSSSVTRDTATETAATASVVPPAYMSSSETLESPAPNYSSIGMDQSGYCSGMSENLEGTSTPESADFTATEESETSSEATEASTAEESVSESGDSEAGAEDAEEEVSSAESEENSEGETAEDEEALAEENTEDDGEHEGDGEEEAQEESATAESSAGGGGDREQEAEGIEAIVTKLPRMTPIRTPYVASAPPQAIERRDEIIKRTGSPPELHHAKVRQTVELVAQAARDAQRRMVWTLGNIAKDTRISIEVMADEIMKAASAAVAQINGAINTAMTDIEFAAAERMDYLDGATILTGEDLEKNREFTNQTITADLMAGSENVTKLNDEATKRFKVYADQGSEKINAIPGQGDVEPLPPPVSSSSGGNSSEADSGGNGGEAPDYQIMADADIHLQEFLLTQSGIIGAVGPNASSYYGIRAAPVLEGMEARTETQLDKSAEEKAKNLNSEANRAQFLIMLLGLTTPVSKYHEDDQTDAERENEREMLSQMTETQAAHYRANKTIMQKCDMAKEYADRDLRDNLTSNIWKAGRKGAQGLRKQAATAEVTLNNNAVPLAEAYRDLIARLNALLPPGQFLDSRELIPKILAAREQAIQLQAQHEATVKEQALATEAQMAEVKKQQVDGLFKAASDSMQGITDVVTQTSFDMELFVMQMTGSMRAGAGACMVAAQEYANRTAEGILNSINGTSGPGMDRINSVAVGFINGQISMAEQAQFQQLSGFVEMMESTQDEGPLIKPMKDAQKDLNDRTTALDNAMPQRDTGTCVLLGAGAVLAAPVVALPAAVALGVYLYETDPSESAVVTQLGGLMWPGILALEEVFADSKSDTLRGRIEDRLDDPEKSNALGLFSTSEEERADARMSIVNNSTHWYSDYNREAREAVLSGMSAGERATLDPTQLDEVRQTITNDLDVHQRDISLAYLEGNRERAVAARTHEALDKGVDDARWGWIFSAQEAQRRSDQARVDAIAGVDAMLRRELAVENAFATTMSREELAGSTNQVYQEFASLTDPRGRSATSFDPQEGRRSMIAYATQSHTSAVLNINPLGVVGMGPLLYASPETVRMSSQASSYIEAAVMHGSDSDEARAARGVYEIAAARREGGSPSETTQTRLSDALENRTLANLEREVREARTPQERSRAERRLAEERTRHRARLQDMARALGAPEDIAGDPAAAEAWMSNQVGNLFAETDSIFQSGPSHRRYGEEMITQGRASLDASVALATDGLGTHDDMLTRAYTDRSHAEIDAANARWAKEHGGESMEQMLGLRNGRDRNNRLRGDNGWWSGFGAETSGDQTMGLEILALGNPENDIDRIAIANLRYEHQRVRGTGFIAERSMAGTDEQIFLDRSRADMARVILAEAIERNPALAGRFDRNPLTIFNADGSINSEIASAAFENGNFRGSATELSNATAHIEYAADAYRAEIDRQESMLTTGITVLALIASIALMCIPGVNVVAAGIISAVIAGAATLTVKYGMRGERYGWEEAATDVATTAIEVATAGIGGALAGGLGKAGMAGRLAKIGDVMVARLGKVGGAIAREAIVSAVSSAASTAIQDDTWKDGLGAGLGRLANSAIRGAVVSAISTGVSESLTAKLNTRMAAGDVDPANLTRWQKMATTLGPHGSEMIREGIANGVGTFASEAVGIVIDYAQGNFRGDFGDALKQVGLATLRETASSAIRGGVTSVNRQRYRELLDVARRGGPMSDGDLKALRLFAISAGAMNYDSDINTVRREVDTARDLLARMPPGLREHASAMDADSLARLMDMLETADLGDLKDPQKKAEFLREMGESVPGLDTRALMAELNNAVSRRAPADTEVALDATQQQHLRTQLGSNLHEGLKFALDDVRLDGLQHLSDAELALAAAMIAGGKFNSAEADALMRAAKARNPDLDEFAFLSNLHSAVKNSESAQVALNKNAEARRQTILDLVPEDAAPIFRHLPNEDIALAQRLIRAGDPGTPQQQDALFRAAHAKNPELTRDQFHQFMVKAASDMRTRLTAEATAKRAAREQAMTGVPEHLRSTLSVLPEAGLVELRLRQMEGSLSPAEKVRLIEMARKANPDVDVGHLSDALDQAVATKPAARISDAETAELRKHLVSGVTEDQRALIQNTPIMVMSDAEFAAMTRSSKGQAVTMIIDGKPVIVMREGANPRALREEGIHALQAHDPQWAKHIGSLDEQHLANWDDLPLEQQIVLYRNKVALELDAQQRMIASIESDIANAKTPQEKAALQRQLEQTRLAHTNLSRRMGEVGNLDAMDLANIKAGFSERPQWLDQPARLFNKGEGDTDKPPLTQKELDEMKNGLLKSVAKSQRAQLERVLDSLPPEAIQKIHELPGHVKNNPDVLNKVLLACKEAPDPVAFAQGYSHLVPTNAIGKEAQLHLEKLGKLKIGQLLEATQLANNLRAAGVDDTAVRKLFKETLLSDDFSRIKILAGVLEGGGSTESALRLHEVMNIKGAVAYVKAMDPAMLQRALNTGLSAEDTAALLKHLGSIKNPEQFISDMEALVAAAGAKGAKYALDNRYGPVLLNKVADLARMAPSDPVLHLLLGNEHYLFAMHKKYVEGFKEEEHLFTHHIGVVEDRIALLKRADDLELAANKALQAAKDQDLDNNIIKLTEFEAEQASLVSDLDTDIKKIESEIETLQKKIADSTTSDEERLGAMEKLQQQQSDLDSLNKKHAEANEYLKMAREEKAAAESQKALLEQKIKLAEDARDATKAHEDNVAAIIKAKRAGADNKDIAALIDKMNAEVSAAKGMSPERIARLRNKSPGEAARKEIVSTPKPEDTHDLGGPKDWLTGKQLDPKTQDIATGHIYPFNKIINEPGFAELPESVQLKILNIRKNLAPQNSSENSSMGDDFVDEFLDRKNASSKVPKVEQTQRDAARTRQEKAQQLMQEVIEKVVAAWRNRTSQQQFEAELQQILDNIK